MLRYMSLAVFLALVPVAPAFSATAVSTAAMTPDEIKATFATGKPFTTTSPSGATYSLTLNADGTAVRSAVARKNGKARPRGETGSWRVSDKSYCSTWGKKAEHCYTVQKSGDGYDIIGPAGKVAHWKL